MYVYKSNLVSGIMFFVVLFFRQSRDLEPISVCCDPLERFPFSFYPVNATGKDGKSYQSEGNSCFRLLSLKMYPY